MSDVEAVATLISQVFGFVVGSKDLGTMKREHQQELVHAAFKIALDKGDSDAADACFAQLRELSQNAGP